jgi:hypothetical protein
MSADFRYMKCPRQTWFLVYTIPPDLRGHPRFLTANGSIWSRRFVSAAITQA